MARYPGAIWRGPIPNVGSGTVTPRLIVMHIMTGTLAGTDSWFHNTSAQVSAHFGVGRTGVVYQWADITQVVWAEASYNSVSISIEHEGTTGESLTNAQIEADAALLAWINSQTKIPLTIVTNPNDSGIIGHGELGAAGGNHPNCPGTPVLNQVPQILAAINPPAPPSPPLITKEVNMNAYDPTSGGYWVCFADGHIEAYGGAPFLGGVNNGGHSGTWSPIGPIIGFSATKDGNGQIGYVITCQRSTPNNDAWAANYVFPRNGSLRP